MKGCEGNRIVTIDGPAGSGKSTAGKRLARRLGFFYLDTGAMYRAVAYQARRTGVEPGKPGDLATLCAGLDLHFETICGENRIFVGQGDVSSAIRSPEMDLLSSAVSAIEEVRVAMTAMQRRIGCNGRLVAEGRDMGTVVFPEAEHKFFLTAPVQVRAERRYRERLAKGEPVMRDEVEKELSFRDEQDSRRSIAPLRPAPDARIIDTSDLDPDQVVQAILDSLSRR